MSTFQGLKRYHSSKNLSILKLLFFGTMMQVITPLFLASLVAGHGHITNIVINGVSYEGWDIDTFPYESDPPTVVAWGTPNTGNGFISPGKSRRCRMLP